MNRSIPPEFRQLYALATEQGWRVETTGSGHLRWMPPHGGEFVITARSPSDHRAVLNATSRLRRSGLILPTGRSKP